MKEEYWTIEWNRETGLFHTDELEFTRAELLRTFEQGCCDTGWEIIGIAGNSREATQFVAKLYQCRANPLDLSSCFHHDEVVDAWLSLWCLGDSIIYKPIGVRLLETNNEAGMDAFFRYLKRVGSRAFSRVEAKYNNILTGAAIEETNA